MPRLTHAHQTLTPFATSVQETAQRDEAEDEQNTSSNGGTSNYAHWQNLCKRGSGKQWENKALSKDQLSFYTLTLSFYV